jgi:uncharacterized protein (DUF58 family)
MPSSVQLSVAPPLARQGPGPIVGELLGALDLVLARRVAEALPGDRRSAGVGAGTELVQLRPYEIGDDVRHIDAAATARTGTPHVRLHVPERSLTTWIVLDISPSMAFGTAARLKADVAEGVVTVLGRLAVRRAGSVGLVTFGDGEVRVHPPRGSRPGIVALRHVIADGVATDGTSDPQGLAGALRKVGLLAKRPGLVAIVTDFRGEEDWLTPIGALRLRHSVIAAEITDPRELELPAVGRLAVVDPETGRHLDIDTSSSRVRQRFAELEAERRAELHRDLRRLRIDHVALSTDGDWLLELGRELA